MSSFLLSVLDELFITVTSFFLVTSSEHTGANAVKGFLLKLLRLCSENKKQQGENQERRVSPFRAH